MYCILPVLKPLTRGRQSRCQIGLVKLPLGHPEGPTRQIDVSRQKLSPHCLEAIFDLQLPSPKLSPKMPPKLSLPHKKGLFILFQINPAVRVIARQVRDKNCLAAIFAPRHHSVSSGPLGRILVFFFSHLIVGCPQITPLNLIEDPSL